MIPPIWKNMWHDLLKLKVYILYDARVLLVGHTYRNAYICASKFMCRNIHSSIMDKSPNLKIYQQ